MLLILLLILIPLESYSCVCIRTVVYLRGEATTPFTALLVYLIHSIISYPSVPPVVVCSQTCVCKSSASF